MIKRILMLSLCLSLISMFNINAQIGNPAPNFTVTDVDGNTHTLYDYLNDGKKVLLDFFFTTCIPCQYYSPQVNLAYQKYGCNEGDVVFMSIDLNNNNAEVHAYEEQYKIEFPSISGDEGGGNEVIDLYNISAFPTFYLIDSTYKIIDIIDPPTLQVFNFRFGMHDIEEKLCSVATSESGKSGTQFFIYPNPANDFIYVKSNNLDLINLSVEYRISDSFGRLLLNGTLQEKAIPTEQLSSGHYILELVIGNASHFIKLFIR